MLKRTHLAVGLAVALYFLPHVTNKIIFFSIVLIASLLPDIDSGFSTFGKNKFARPVQVMTKHRGIIHSYTLCILISTFLAFNYPRLALPFFLGYSFHLILDSMTPNGIQPFWPAKLKSVGSITTGGKIETTIFYTIAVVDLFLLIKLFL